MKRSVSLLSTLLALGLLGCTAENPAATVTPAPASASRPATKQPAPVAATIARIVFVDKKQCCDCTRDRIAKSWKALTDAMGSPPSPPVERIHLDTQAARAAPYIKQRAIMVPPAIYFFDQQGKLVQMLQGELKSAQIKKILGAS